MSEKMDVAKDMMSLAEQAWSELLKEKMKKLWQEKTGAKLDKIAQISVDGCGAYWTKVMAGETPTEDDRKQFEATLMAAFKE